MDELLNGPQGAGRIAQGEGLPLIGRLREGAQVLRERWDELRERLRGPLGTARRWLESHPISPALYLAVSSAVGLAAVLGTVYTASYVVNLDGVDIGVVEDPAVYARAAAGVEARASRILGHEYTLDHRVSFSPALSLRTADFSTVGQLESYLFNEIGEIMKGYVLTVDGAVIGASDAEGALSALLEDIAAPYRTEDTVDYGFVERVEVRSDYITSDFNLDIEAMRGVLIQNTTGETTYEVVKGDTYIGIAYANDMGLDELMALNPQASLNSLFVGDVLNVKKVIPYLSVYTVDRQTYTQAVESPVEYVDDPNQYIGDSKVLTQGVPGEALVTADVVFINGYEDGRTVRSSTVLSEPTTTVIARGTAERPKTASTGRFQWPIYGRINSGFGGRSLYGRYDYHLGLDIAASYGAAIHAADGGLVSFAGWQGSYGNLVIITHDNGVKTYYAHNSSLTVSVGQRVYQGQTVARAGSTGNSTGVHCHFGVLVNGSFVNPRNYLP